MFRIAGNLRLLRQSSSSKSSWTSSISRPTVQRVQHVRAHSLQLHKHTASNFDRLYHFSVPRRDARAIRDSTPTVPEDLLVGQSSCFLDKRILSRTQNCHALHVLISHLHCWQILNYRHIIISWFQIFEIFKLNLKIKTQSLGFHNGQQSASRDLSRPHTPHVHASHVLRRVSVLAARLLWYLPWRRPATIDHAGLRTRYPKTTPFFQISSTFAIISPLIVIFHLPPYRKCFSELVIYKTFSLQVFLGYCLALFSKENYQQQGISVCDQQWRNENVSDQLTIYPSCVNAE